MDAVLVCAQRGDASTKRPNAPTIADAAPTLHAVIADGAAALIVFVNRETSLCSLMMKYSFEGALVFECPIPSETVRATKSDHKDPSESIARWCTSTHCWAIRWRAVLRSVTCSS